MPWKLPARCPVPLCSNLQPCPVHKRERGPDKRPPSSERGYDSGWRKQRVAALKRDDFTCQRCGRRAVVVHHIIPLDKGGTHDLSNTVSLCRGCHETHHGRKRKP